MIDTRNPNWQHREGDNCSRMQNGWQPYEYKGQRALFSGRTSLLFNLDYLFLCILIADLDVQIAKLFSLSERPSKSPTHLCWHNIFSEQSVVTYFEISTIVLLT